MGEDFIKIKKLKKSYQSKYGQTVNALQDINLTLPKKGFIFIVGTSGSGKSTLLNLIGGIDKVSEGCIYIDQDNINQLKNKELSNYRNERIGFVFQEFNLIEDLTIEENLSLVIDYENDSSMKNRLKEILIFVGLQGYEKRFPRELSGGEKQRVAIARAYLKNSDIILADEPTGSLDSKTANEIFNLLKKLSKEKLVLIVSHDKDFAAEYGDRIIELKNGRVVSDHIKNIYEEISEIETSTNIKKNKSRLSYKTKLNLSFKFLNVKKFRLFFTILISALSFTFFGLSLSMYNYDSVKSGLSSMQTNDINYVNITRKIKGDQYIGTIQKLDDNHITEFNEYYKTLNFKPIFSPMMNENLISYENMIGNKENSATDYIYKPYLKGFYELTTKDLELTNFSLLSGRIPKHDHEINITLHTYEVFKKHGYLDDNNMINEINNYSDILEKKLNLDMYGNKESFIIVGIIDSKFNKQKYIEILKDGLKTKKEIDALNDFNDILYNGFHSLIFVNEDYIRNNSMNRYYPNNNFKNDTYINEFGSSRTIYSYNKLINEHETNILMFNDNRFDEIGVNDVIVSDISYITSILNDNKLLREGIIVSYLKTINISMLDELLLINGLKSNFDNYTTIDEYISKVYSSIYEDINFGKVFKYPNGVESKRDLEIKVLEQILTSYNDKNIKVNSSMADTSVDLKVYNFNVVGIFIPSYLNSNEIYMTKETLIKNNIFEEGIYSALISYTKLDNKNDIENLIKLSFDKSGSEYFLYNNYIINKVFEIDFSTKQIASTFLYVGLVFMFFSIILLATFINTLVSDRKKDIGIIRSLGISIKDTTVIFLVQSIIISTLSFIISIMFIFISVNIINNILANKFYFPIRILNFGFIEFLILLVIPLIVASITSGLTTLKLSRIPPIDAIINRS